MSLSKSLNFNYNIIDCQTGITPDFSKIYLSNTDMAHINDWGIIAFGLSKTYPQEKVSVKGVCAEVGRCFYYRDGNIKKNITENDLLQLVPGWSEFSFIREEIKKWNESIKKNSFNYNIYDLFYWEHRTGGWQAQSQLEFNIVQE